MIIATLLRNASGEIEGFYLTGHAGFGVHGQDIVCAAASMLAINCVNSLELVANVTPQVEEDADAGILRVSLPSSMTDDQRRDAQVLLRALQQGFHDLSDAYPQHVRFQLPG